MCTCYRQPYVRVDLLTVHFLSPMRSGAETKVYTLLTDILEGIEGHMLVRRSIPSQTEHSLGSLRIVPKLFLFTFLSPAPDTS